MKDKEYRKVRDHFHHKGEYRGALHSLYYLKYSVAKKLPIAFHNGYGYDYHVIIKELAEELKNNLRIKEKTKKYITFTVLIEKAVTIID